MNQFCVGNAGGKIVIQSMPDRKLSRDEAIELAVWLVAVAGITMDEFRARLDEVTS